jgi:hypothetical protein
MWQYARKDPEELDSFVRLGLSEEDSLFCGGTPNRIHGLRSPRTYDAVGQSNALRDVKGGGPTLRQALPTMPFEQQELRPLTHSLLAARALTVVLVRSAFASVFPVSQVAP